MHTPGVVLAGIGHHFPGEPVGNDHFERIEALGVDDAWIQEHTGVRTRHFPGPQERPAEMGARAAELALKDAGIDATDLDVIIGTSATTRPRTNPSSIGNNYMDISLPVQRQLGATGSFCFDVTAVACAGFLYGSVVARGLLASMGIDNALVVCAENPKNILNFGFRNSVLFGAGAAAAVWQRTEDRTGLIDAVLCADGRYYDAFDIDDSDKMIMRGKLVGEMGPRFLVDAAEKIFRRNGITAADIDWCVPHQGNINLILPFAAAAGIPREKVLLNLHRRGNTSSVGLPSALSEHIDEAVVRPGDLVLGVSIGRGFSWGAMLFTYK